MFAEFISDQLIPIADMDQWNHISRAFLAQLPYSDQNVREELYMSIKNGHLVTLSLLAAAKSSQRGMIQTGENWKSLEKSLDSGASTAAAADGEDEREDTTSNSDCTDTNKDYAKRAAARRTPSPAGPCGAVG